MEQTKTSKIYNYKNRVIIRILLAMFTISAIVFGSMGVYVLSMVGTEEIFSQGSAQSTHSYQRLVSEEVRMVRESLEARRPFETNGELDYEKTIDIMNLQATDKNQQNKDTTFTVKDLTNMNSNGVFSEIENVSNLFISQEGRIEVSVEFTGEEGYENGEASGNDQRMSEIIKWLGTERLATPISGKPLTEYVQDNKEGITALNIFEALYEVKNMMYLYDDFGSRSSSAGTNLCYYIKDNENDEVVTNTEWKDLAQAEAGAKINGISLECKRGANGCFIGKNSTAGFNEAKQELKQTPLTSKSEEVVITLDKTYPLDDHISRFIYSYNHLKPHFVPFLVLAILSLIGFVVCFVLATITTGQSEKKGAVCLNIFDKIPTEIGAAIVCVLGLIALGTNVGIYDMVTNGSSNNVANIIYMIAMLMTAMLIATWGYLSLVRRIKAKDLWKNSLFRRIFALVRKAYRTGEMNVRFVIAFITFVLANIFLTVLGIPGLILLLIFDVAILVKLLGEVAQRQAIKDGLDTIAAGNLDYKLDTNNLQQDNQEMANSVNKIADGMQSAVEKSMKNERMRSELITNVSHDIKTPLTSIINYVDLLKREDIKNPQVKGYIDILDAKSQRLKHLTEDLVEASKVSSGNIELHMDNLFVQELLQQAEGEFSEKLKERKLELVSSLAAEPVIIKADGRQLWRIFENLLNNIAKYALEGTRVYVDLTKEDKRAVLMFKNMSQEALNINADELTERFVRGDISRTTEGSGLGLSIAKSLTELQGGKFDIYLDGDLFKVTLTFGTV